MKKKQQKNTSSSLCFLFSIKYKHPKKQISWRNQRIVPICWCGSGDSPLNHSTQRLREVSQPWHSTWTAAHPQLAADGETLSLFPIFNYLFWGDVTAPFHWGVAHFYLNYAFISKETIIYVATNELRCSSLLINAALCLHVSFPAALIYLPVRNRPLGGNISPAAVL